MSNNILTSHINHKSGQPKIRYSRSRARKCRNVLEKKYRRNMDVYYCPVCGGYHIGGRNEH
jgi:hypothetical protein